MNPRLRRALEDAGLTLLVGAVWVGLIAAATLIGEWVA